MSTSSHTEDVHLEVTSASNEGLCENRHCGNETDSDYLPKRKLKMKIYGNVLVLSAAFLAYYVGICPTDAVHNSTNVEWELRNISFNVLLGSMMLQAMLFNNILMHLFGDKRSILIGLALEIINIGSKLHPRWWTLLPSAIVAGIGRSLLMTTGYVFLVKSALMYCNRFHLSKDVDTIKWTFFSIFCSFQSGAKILSYLVTSIILNSGLENFDLSTKLESSDGSGILNITNSTNEYLNFSFCGPNFCPESIPNSPSPIITHGIIEYQFLEFTRVNELCGFSLGCLVLSAIIILLFLQSEYQLAKFLVSDNESDSSPTSVSTSESAVVECQESVRHQWKHIFDTAFNWKHTMQLLLIPLLLFNGIDDIFFTNDFTKSFVGCIFGTPEVGFAIAWFALTAPLAVCICSQFRKTYYRSIPFIVAFSVHFGGVIVLLYLDSTNYSLKTVFLFTIIWGIGSGLWSYLLPAFIGIIFEKNLEASFSNYSLFQSLGMAISHWSTNLLCTDVKLYILITLVILGFSGYMLIEFLFYRQRNKRQ